MKLRVSRDNPALVGYRDSKIETVIDRAMRAACDFQSCRNQRLRGFHLERQSQQGFGCDYGLFSGYLAFPKALPEDVPKLRKNKIRNAQRVLPFQEPERRFTVDFR